MDVGSARGVVAESKDIPPRTAGRRPCMTAGKIVKVLTRCETSRIYIERLHGSLKS